MGAIHQFWQKRRPGAEPGWSDAPARPRTRSLAGRSRAPRPGTPPDLFATLLLATACAVAGLLLLWQIEPPGALPF